MTSRILLLLLFASLFAVLYIVDSLDDDVPADRIRVSMRGWMYKRGQGGIFKGSRFRKRYFVLNAKSKQLVYFLQEAHADEYIAALTVGNTSERAQGTIELSEVTQVEQTMAGSRAGGLSSPTKTRQTGSLATERILLLHTAARTFQVAPLPNNDHVYAQEWIRCIRESSAALVGAAGDEGENATPEGENGEISSPAHRRRYTEGYMYDPHTDDMPSGVLKQGWLQVKRKMPGQAGGGGTARSKRVSMFGAMFGGHGSPGATAAGYVRRFVVLTSTTMTVYKRRPKSDNNRSDVDMAIDLDQVMRVTLPAGGQYSEPMERNKRSLSVGRNMAMTKPNSYHHGKISRSNVFQVECFDMLVGFQSAGATLHEEWLASVQEACLRRQNSRPEDPTPHTQKRKHTTVSM